MSKQRQWGAVVMLCLTGLCSSIGQAAAPEDSIEVKNNLPLLLQTLETLPYSTEGAGPVVYVIEFSTCPYAKRFETEYGKKLASMGFQVRRVYYGVDEATQNNAAAAAASRDPALQRAFMFDGRRAANVYDSPAALEAYQDVPDKLKVIVGVLQQNGWRSDRVVSPMFIYPNGKALFADGGYRVEHFEGRILPRLKLATRGATGAAATPVSASTTPPPPAGKSSTPDVLGFQIGMTLAEVKARAATLKLTNNSGDKPVEVIKGLPNSNHRSNYTAWDVGPQGVFVFRFATPPNDARLVAVSRTVDYKTSAPNAAPIPNTLRTAFVQKFGNPSEAKVINTYAEELLWVWDRQGKLQTSAPGAPCRNVALMHFSQTHTGVLRDLGRKALDAGCASFVLVQILNEGTGVVTKLEYYSVDVARADPAVVITEQAVRDYAQQQIDKQRKQAESQTPAI